MRPVLALTILMALAGCKEDFADWPEPEAADAALGDGFAAVFQAAPGADPLSIGSLSVDRTAEPIRLD